MMDSKRVIDLIEREISEKKIEVQLLFEHGNNLYERKMEILKALEEVLSCYKKVNGG